MLQHPGSDARRPLGAPSPRWQLRSPLARAIVPVFGGIAVLALIFLATWLLAVVQREDATENLARSTFEVGSVEAFARAVAEDGPIVFADLNTTSGRRTVVVNHAGEDPTRGWELYSPYPIDRDPSCIVEQVVGTAQFVDCARRTIDVTELARPAGAFPVVENQETLILDLRRANAAGS